MKTDRYDRQRRLPEVGDAGQERLANARLDVNGNDGAILEAEYLCRAGVGALELHPRREPRPFRHENGFRFRLHAR